MCANLVDELLMLMMHKSKFGNTKKYGLYGLEKLIDLFPRRECKWMMRSCSWGENAPRLRSGLK